jgi:ribonuclease BN (tRNA processing enzyme)
MTTTVTILGSGTCVPSLERSSCSVLVACGQSKLLFDIGAGTMRRLLETGTEIYDISHIFISHFHPDHTGELVSFLFANKYPDENRRQEPLTIVAGKGFLKFFAGLKSAFGNWIALSPNLLRIVELDTRHQDTCRFDSFEIASAPTNHNPESIAYRVKDSSGNTIVYSGDTDVSDNLEALADSVDLFICESALPDSMKVDGHLSPSHAGRIASRAGVKKLLLTHFYPECDTTDMEMQCRKTWTGPLTLARDLMKIEIHGET